MAARGHQGEKRSAAAAGEEPVLSLLDVLEEDDALEDEACAVLGGSDAEQCSYPQGYVKRQALYACNTCTLDKEEPAGICLACTYKCHEGHDLFELYTKRNFRCDCGNGKFKQLECKLYPDKEKYNTANKYNANFFGLYCTCKRPYPDPEDEIPDEMMQCIVCEDWFHGRHLGCVPPEHLEFQEMVCQGCTNRCSFLWAYSAKLGVPGATKIIPAETDYKEVKVDDCPAESAAPVTIKEEVQEEEMLSCPSTSSGSEQKFCNGETSQPVEAKVKSNTVCKLEEYRTNQRPTMGMATYWPNNWRSHICRCAECMTIYAQLDVLFLLDDCDTVQAYEHKGKSEVQENRDPLMTALSSMDRVQQVELICEYNDMKTELKDYLKTFAEEGKMPRRYQPASHEVQPCSRDVSMAPSRDSDRRIWNRSPPSPLPTGRRRRVSSPPSSPPLTGRRRRVPTPQSPPPTGRRRREPYPLSPPPPTGRHHRESLPPSPPSPTGRRRREPSPPFPPPPTGHRYREPSPPSPPPPTGRRRREVSPPYLPPPTGRRRREPSPPYLPPPTRRRRMESSSPDFPSPTGRHPKEPSPQSPPPPTGRRPREPSPESPPPPTGRRPREPLPQSPRLPTGRRRREPLPPPTRHRRTEPLPPPTGHRRREPSPPPTGHHHREPSPPPIGHRHREPSPPPTGHRRREPSPPPTGHRHREPSPPSTGRYRRESSPSSPSLLTGHHHREHSPPSSPPPIGRRHRESSSPSTAVSTGRFRREPSPPSPPIVRHRRELSSTSPSPPWDAERRCRETSPTSPTRSSGSSRFPHTSQSTAPRATRKGKFSDVENFVLVEQIGQRYSRLLGSESCRVEMVMKTKMWNDITDAVNAVGSHPRTVENCKKRYQDIKGNVKKKLAELRRYNSVIGGCPPARLILTEAEKVIQGLMADETMTGVPGTTDTDRPLSDSDESISTSPSIIQQLEEPEEPEQPEETVTLLMEYVKPEDLSAAPCPPTDMAETMAEMSAAGPSRRGLRRGPSCIRPRGRPAFNSRIHELLSQQDERTRTFHNLQNTHRRMLSRSLSILHEDVSLLRAEISAGMDRQNEILERLSQGMERLSQGVERLSQGLENIALAFGRTVL